MTEIKVITRPDGTEWVIRTIPLLTKPKDIGQYLRAIQIWPELVK
jgi:hypothetical protein